MGFAKSVIRWIYLLDPETVPKLFFHQINPRNEEISTSTFQKYILLLCCDQYEPSYSTLARKWDPISVPCVSFQKLQNPFSKRPIFRQTSLCKFSKLQNPFSSPKLQTPVFKGYKTFSQVGQSPIFFSVVQTTHFLKDPFL